MFDGFGVYDFIMADPPWKFKAYSDKNNTKGAIAKYGCMSLDDVKAMPVSDLAAASCILWLWATNPMLPHALETMASWGFIFKTAGTWGKMTKHDKIAFGTGYVLRSASEPFLIGTRGSPKFTKSTRSLLLAKVRAHSQKPEECYPMAEGMLNRDFHPEPKFLELFSRTTRKGWDTWGDEVGKFGDAAAPIARVKIPAPENPDQPNLF